MAVIIPQVITPSKASGAQVINGSLKFDSGSNQYLSRTPGSAGNRNTWTWSGWVKRSDVATSGSSLFAAYDSSTARDVLRFDRSASGAELNLQSSQGGSTYGIYSNPQKLRDTGWYHIVAIYDDTDSTTADKQQLYVNGERLTAVSTENNGQDGGSTTINNTDIHYIGARSSDGSPSLYFDGAMSQVYFVDGQALGPEYFGYTDGLTNTWKPKKYEGDFGTNGFYLPFDGSAPIGQDQSGKGNDWTPVNFGGSLALDNPQVSGARPILNTTQGGARAGVGVFGSKENKTVTVTVASKTGGGNAYFFDSVERDSLATIRGSTITFDTTDSTNNSHPFKLSSTNADSSSGTEYTDGVAYYINGSTVSGSDYVSNYSTNGGGTGFRGIKWTVPHNVSTTYYYCTVHSGMGEGGRLTSTTDETKADPYAWKNVLALPLVGSKEDVSNQINSGSTAKTISSNGSPASSGEQSNFYGKSFQFIETDSDRLDCTIAALGTRDFTLEFWFYTSSTTGYQTLAEYGDHTSNGFYLSVRDGVAIMARSSVGADIANAGGGTPGSLPSGSLINTPTGKYHHIALTRESNTAKLFQNGKYIGSGTWSTNYTPTNLRLAHSIYSAGSAEYLTGFMQDVRLYDGVVKYTGTTVNEQSFVVPSTDPNILPDTPSGVAGGSKLTKITDGAVNFDGTDDELNVPNSGTDFQFGTGDFTVECFVYYNAEPSSSRYIIDMRSNAGNLNAGSLAVGYSGDNSKIEWTIPSSTILNVSWANYISKGTWNHIAVARSGSTIKMFINGEVADTATDNTNYIDPSDITIGDRYINSNATQWFDGAISNVRIVKGTALYTSRFTPPTAPLTNVTNTKLLCCQSNTSAISVEVTPGTFSNSGTTYSSNVSGAVAGSPYDATKMFDGSISTYTDHNAQNSTITWTQTLTSVTSLRVYIHGGNSTNTVTTVGGSGTQVDTISTDFGPGWHNITLGTTGSTINSIAFARGGSGNFLSIYAVEVNGTILIDNFYGKAIARAGDAAATNFNPFITDINTVRGQETGYATFSPLLNGGNNTLSDGNTFVTGGSNWNTSLCTGVIESGKLFVELTHKGRQSASDNDIQFGLFGLNNSEDGIPLASTKDLAAQSTGYVIVDAQAQWYNNSSSTSYGTTWSTPGDVVGLRYNADTGKLGFIINGIDQGDISTTLSTSQKWIVGVSLRGGGAKAELNFGQKPFKFPPPDGFQPLNNANLRPVKVISRPDQYVGVTTFTGNGGTQRIDVGHEPDLVWLKDRGAGEHHGLFDTIRGPLMRLVSDYTYASTSRANTVTSFNNNGVTLGSAGEYNGSTDPIVCWSWKAGGSKGTFNKDDVGYASAAAAGLTAGDVTPTAASVGTKQGFSIITWTAPTWNGGPQQVPHGLTQSPSFIIAKVINDSASWYCYHKDLDSSSPEDKYIVLNDTAAAGTLANSWGTSAPNSTTFGDRQLGWSDGKNVISYIWHDVPGLQKFGTYKGLGGTASGSFVELGFRPALVWVKDIGNGNSNSHWCIFDKLRPGFNKSPAQNRLHIDAADAEDPDRVDEGNGIDILSNGFRVRSNNWYETNLSGATYIYCAWADAPAIDLYGGGANAR